MVFKSYFNFIYGILLMGASLVAQTVKCLPTMRETRVQSLGREISWRRKWQPTPAFLDFSGSSDEKESACNTGDLGSIPGLGRYWVT